MTARPTIAGVIAAALLLALPAAAAADEPYDPGASPENVGLAPGPVRAPALSGSPSVGGTLTGDRGTWLGASLKSKWLRCNVASSSCASTGDTDLGYKVTAADIGFVIKLRVLGTTGAATKVVDSPASITVPAPPATGTPSPPANVKPPSISGTVRVGVKLTGLPGQWTGGQPIGFVYGWFSCTPNGSACLSRSTSQSYTPGSADAGRRLVLSVLAQSPFGSATKAVTSAAVAKASSLRRLAPFPRLLIGGRVAGRNTSISGFRFARVPRGSTVSISCRGRGCPFKGTKVKTHTATGVRVRRLQTTLGSGTVIVATVRKGATLGKYTRVRVRRGLAPARVDRCVKPGSSRPVACS